MEDEANINRRKFIKDLGITVLGSLIVPKGIPRIPEQNEGEEKIIQEEIKKCKEIIEGKKYDQILDNPYLVSALYYSDSYLKNLQEEKQIGQKRIVAEIAPLLDQEFRKKYIETISQIANLSGQLKGLNFEENCQPILEMNFAQNLEANHKNAIDIFAKEGSPVSAMRGGLVVLAEGSWKKGEEFSTSSNFGGNTVIVFNPKENKFYRYAHLKDVNVTTKNTITSGANLGTVGNSGQNASKAGHGEHLHLEVHQYHTDTNEMKALSAKEIKKDL